VAGARFTAAYLRLALAHRARRRLIRLERRLSRYRPRRVAHRAAGRVIARHGPQTGAAIRARLAALDGHPVTGPVTRRTVAPLFERVAEAVNAPGGRVETPD